MLGADPDDSDWRIVISRLRNLETASQRARDWMQAFGSRQRDFAV